MKTLAGKPSILAGSRRDFSHKSRQIKKKTNSKRTDDCQGRCIESWQQPGDSMMLALEPRLLFDAAGLVAGLDLLSCQNEVDPDCLTVEPDYGIMAPFDMFALAAPFEIESHSTIIFIDPGVADHENLISDSSADARVVVLDPAKDGIAQIDDVLSQCRDVSSVHIISHGTSGSITLGKTVLSNDTIDNYSASLQEWGTNLCKGADILIYGCNVAQGINGQAFVAQLSDITGADVAASTDVTGAEDRGGDWDLETRIGIIDSGLAVSVQAQADYANTLADITVNQNSDNRDVYMLNSIDDSDGINLREALFMAEKYYAGADTITFDNTLNGQTITLQYDALEINSSDGVIISGDIDGDGNYDITINGDGKYRVFTLGIDDNLTLSGLYITGGTDANKGGGIYAYRSTLALDNCKVGGNTVTSTVKDWEYGGGGIFTDRTTLYVTNCTISGNNTGARGGGLNIYDGTATISNSTISNNSSNDNGGGIVNYWADVTITDCTISNNSAALLGGGINSNTPVWKYVTISNSTISDNISDYAGGGICNSGNLDISNSTIAGNSATNDYYGNLGGWGGGIFNFSFGLDVKATITNSTISDNSADDLGGGIMNLKEMYVYDSTLTENTAPNGSGLYCYSAYWGVYNTYNTIGSSIVEGEIKLGINTITSQGDNLFEQETVPGADGASDILDAEIDLQPEGNDDSFDTNEDTAFTTGNVLSNDTDFLPPDTLTITSIDTSLTHGLVTNNN
ncbi:MAG: DUF4347 domain-containing protein, partial [Desulfobacteraceae bacterium]|nr:DUF4347 domain-containing protein [Desulfobacteraceae bacterium]